MNLVQVYFWCPVCGFVDRHEVCSICGYCSCLSPSETTALLYSIGVDPELFPVVPGARIEFGFVDSVTADSLGVPSEWFTKMKSKMM